MIAITTTALISPAVSGTVRFGPLGTVSVLGGRVLVVHREYLEVDVDVTQDAQEYFMDIDGENGFDAEIDDVVTK